MSGSDLKSENKHTHTVQTTGYMILKVVLSFFVGCNRHLDSRGSYFLRDCIYIGRKLFQVLATGGAQEVTVVFL